MTRLAIALAVTLALLGGAYGLGRTQGTAAAEARHMAALAAAARDATEAARKLAAAEQERRRQSQALEDAANADPVSAPACLPVERVRRLNLR